MVFIFLPPHLLVLHSLPFWFAFFLVSHSLSSHCLLVPLCSVFTWEPLTLTSIYLWSFIIVPQSWKQAMLFLLWSSINVHWSNQHKTNVVGVHTLVDLICSVVVELIVRWLLAPGVCTFHNTYEHTNVVIEMEMMQSHVENPCFNLLYFRYSSNVLKLWWFVFISWLS